MAKQKSRRSGATSTTTIVRFLIVALLGLLGTAVFLGGTKPLEITSVQTPPPPQQSEVQKPKAKKFQECKSNRTDNPALFKVWRVLENNPPIKLRVAGPLVDDPAKAEPLVTNQQMFVDRNGHWVRAIKSGADPELKLDATLDFPANVVPQLPAEDRTWKYETCALVANSGSLLNDKEYGKQIDSRDAVIRINYAPVQGFEAYVGSRTTFDVINQQHTKVLAEVNGHSGSLPTAATERRNSTLIVFEVTSSFARRHLYGPLLEKQRAAGADMAILSPAIAVQSHRVWNRFGQALEAAKLWTARKMLKPMSGIFSIMFAVQVCEHVHLYGFSPYSGGKGEQPAPYHYFDKVSGVTKHHSFEAAYEVFKQMSKWPCAGVKISLHS